MKSKSTFLILLLTLFAALEISAQKKEVVISIDTISTDVYMLTGQGGNIGIYVGEDNAYMIDDQFEHLSKKLKTSISSITKKPMAILFNTHMHGDHSGGNAKFNSDNTILVAHDKARERIKLNSQKKLDANKISKEEYLKMLPEVTFSDDITFYDDDETILVFHVHNAHTDGDAMIYFTKNNVLHMGDTYFSKRYPFIDLNSGGSITGYIDAHKKALLLIDGETAIIPGHGRPSNKAELETYLTMLEDLKLKVATEINAGKTLEEVANNETITAKYDETYGTGFIKPQRMRETLYNSLKKQQ